MLTISEREAIELLKKCESQLLLEAIDELLDEVDQRLTSEIEALEGEPDEMNNVVQLFSDKR